MYHLVARAAPGTLLIRTHAEAAALWADIVHAFPEIIALCLMPNHFHLVLAHADAADRQTDAMRAFAQWRNHARDERAPVWTFPHPEPEPLADEQKERRNVRYTHLNPCRAHIVADPLAWPWSTHRDAVGLAAWPVIPTRRDTVGFHHYVSADESTSVDGTPLPGIRFADHGWDASSRRSAACAARPCRSSTSAAPPAPWLCRRRGLTGFGSPACSPGSPARPAPPSGGRATTPRPAAPL